MSLLGWSEITSLREAASIAGARVAGLSAR
jgi:hypothetical protein